MVNKFSLLFFVFSKSCFRLKTFSSIVMFAQYSLVNAFTAMDRPKSFVRRIYDWTYPNAYFEKDGISAIVPAHG